MSPEPRPVAASRSSARTASAKPIATETRSSSNTCNASKHPRSSTQKSAVVRKVDVRGSKANVQHKSYGPEIASAVDKPPKSVRAEAKQIIHDLAGIMKNYELGRLAGLVDRLNSNGQIKLGTTEEDGPLQELVEEVRLAEDSAKRTAFETICAYMRLTARCTR